MPAPTQNDASDCLKDEQRFVVTEMNSNCCLAVKQPGPAAQDSLAISEDSFRGIFARWTDFANFLCEQLFYVDAIVDLLRPSF